MVDYAPTMTTPPAFDPSGPAESDIYAWNWSDYLQTGETISAFEFDIPAPLVKGAENVIGEETRILLTGGAPGVDYPCRCRVTTNLGRASDWRTTFVKVREL